MASAEATRPPSSRKDYITETHPLELTVPVELAGKRLDQALARLLLDHSRARLQSWIKSGGVRVDGECVSPDRKLWGGERIRVVPVPREDLDHQAQPLALDILFEDDALIAVNKPAGLVVHPGSGNWDGTLLNALLHHAPQLRELPRAGIVHRLDKDTSGALAVAKTLPAQTELVRQLQARTVKREYLAVVHGVLQRDGKVEAPIGRHPRARTRMAVVATGKPALTHYRVVERFAAHTLLHCQLETGRTHQIRVHMQAIGHPIAGDPVYRGQCGNERLAQALKAFGRQALHAWRLGLVHPLTGAAMRWEASMPEDMRQLLRMLKGAN